MTHTSMDDRSAVLLAMAECRGNAAVLAACDLFLSVCKVNNTPTFVECCIPSSDCND